MTSDRFGPLAERPFRLLWLAQTTSAAGDALVGVALAFAVIRIGGRASELGIVLAAFMLFRAGFIVVGGVWADRLPRRLVMIAADVVRAAVEALTAVLVLTGRMEIWMFVVTAAIFGLASAFFGPASTGLVPQTVSAPRLQQANALIGFSRNATNVFGPALAGVLVAAIGPGWVFALNSASFAGSAAFLLALHLPRADRPPRQRFLRDLAEGWQEAWSRGWLRAGFMLPAVANLGLGVFFVLGPIVAEDELGGADAWGLILSVGAAGGLLAGVAAYRLRPSRPIAAAFAVWAFGSLPLLALIPPLPAVAIAVANAVFLFGIVFGNTLYETVLQREIPPERLSRVSALDWMGSIIFMPVGLALAGPVAHLFGVDATLAAAAVLIVLASAAGLMVPSVRALRAPATPSPEPSASAAGGSPVPVPPDPLP